MPKHNGRFALSLDRFAKKTGASLNVGLRKVSIEFYKRVVLRSPVDTGRFRAAWTISTGGLVILHGTISKGQGLPALSIGTVGVERIKAGERDFERLALRAEA